MAPKNRSKSTDGVHDPDKTAVKTQAIQTTALAPTVDGGDMLAVVGGYHGAPHRVLGPHVVERDGASLVSIRVFRPLDAAVTVHEFLTGARTPMTLVDPNGFFEAQFPNRSEPFPYRLLLTPPAAFATEPEASAVEASAPVEIELEDPYRFPFLLTEFDIHLFHEGN